MLKILWIILLLIVTNQSYAKSKCEFEMKQYKSIQSLLRHKSTEYLRKLEHEKHNEYQNCRKRKNKKNKSGETIATYKKQSQTSKKYYSNKPVKDPFSNSTINIKIKSKFKGEKQDGWLKYYKTPPGCKNPKEIATFSKCLNHKNVEAKNFSIVWASRGL